MTFALLAEVRYAARRLSRAPGFVLVSMVTLGLGLGATTALFSFINGVLLKPLAVPDFERIAQICLIEDGDLQWRSALDSAWVRRLEQSDLPGLEALSGLMPFVSLAEVSGSSRFVKGEAVRGQFFEVLGVRPKLGRLLGPPDETPGTEVPIVISERLWTRLFGADASALGRTIKLGGRPLVLVGVAPDRFRGLDGARFLGNDVWIPHYFLRQVRADTDGRCVLFARIERGVSFEQADAEIRVAGQAISPEGSGRSLGLRPLWRAVTNNPPVFYAAATAFLALSALVLLIACANLTNLLLARISTRTAEIAVRLTLGAEPRHIFRLIAVETSLVVALAALLGLAVAFATVVWLGESPLREQGGLAPRIDASADWRVFAFVLLTAAMAAAAIMTAAASRFAHVDALASLSAAAGVGGSSSADTRSRRRLIASQMACTVVLLVAAGLLVRSTLAGVAWNPGFDTAHAAVGQLDYQRQGYAEAQAREMTRRVVDSIKGMPGIAHVAVASALPGLGGGESLRLTGDGLRETDTSVRLISVTPDFFNAVGLGLVQGQTFASSDVSGVEPVVILTRSLAERFWPNEDPVGRYLRPSGPRSSAPAWRVVGVAPDVAVRSSNPVDRRIVFTPLEQRYPRRLALTVVVRGPAPADQLVRVLREALQVGAPEAALHDVRTLRSRVDDAMTSVRLMARALSAIGMLGITLAVVGVYGVVACLVSHRRREFGIMKALGATDRRLYGLMAREGLWMLLRGIVPGLLAAAGVGFALRGFLVGIPPYDWVTFIVVPAGLLVVGLAACVMPVAQVIRRDPLAVLREL